MKSLNSLRFKISIPTLIIASITLVIFSLFSYFYLEKLQLKLLNKEMFSLSALFNAFFSENAKKTQGLSEVDLIRKFHNPSASINYFMDYISKNSEYPVQLKIATQNPTNLLFISNEKDDQLINRLKAEKTDSYFVIEPDVNGIPVYYFVKAIKAERGCLSCHGTNPPEFMVKYFDGRGTGYKEGDIMAAAIFSTPIQYIKEENLKTIVYFVAVLSALFIVMTFILNLLVDRLVIKPIKDLTKAAEDISMGEISKEIKQTSNDEIGKLQASFERMRVSIAKLMELLEK